MAPGTSLSARSNENVVRRVDGTTGTITIFAGDPGGTGALGGPATSYALNSIDGLACDSAGNLYIAEWGAVLKVNAATGDITQIAVTTNSPNFGYFAGIAIDSSQNIYVSDSTNNVVRKIDTKGNNTVFAGRFTWTTGGDGGPAIQAGLSSPHGLAVDGAGNVYIADSSDETIREVNTSGIINTVAGALYDCCTASGDGSPAKDVGLDYPKTIAVDKAGNIYAADWPSDKVRKFTVSAPPPSTAAAPPIFSLAAGTYADAQTLTMRDTTPGAEIYVSLNGSAPTTTGQGYHGPINVTGSVTIQAVALAPGYLPSSPTKGAYTISAAPTAVISTVAGSNVYGFTGFGGAATSARIEDPQAVAFDGAGNLYIADSANSVVWMVAAATGNISVVAGTGTSGEGADGGLAIATALSSPGGVAVDKAGNLYIADYGNGTIRMVAAQTGIMTTFAGPGQYRTLGDGGPATSAFLGDFFYGLAFDSAGNLYLADASNYRIRMIAAKTGIITTVAGGGTANQLGDGGPATAASLANPTDVTLDPAGNLYILDSGDSRIRKVDATTKVITTIAGNGYSGTTGDGGPATAAKINVQEGIAVDGLGNVYFSDQSETVRRVDAITGIITTMAGDKYFGYGGDGGVATVAELYSPQGLAFDADGSLYIAEKFNDIVRKVTFLGQTPTPVISVASGTYRSIQTVSIRDSVSAAPIYFTTDGTTPRANSSLYSGPITVSASETLQAIAVAAGHSQSAAATAVYTIQLTVPPTVTVTPSASSITTTQGLTVAVAVAGGSGNPTPTGTVTLTGGGYTSAATVLSGGSAKINIPTLSLAVGSDTLSATYTPDSTGSATYASASGTTSVTVTKTSPTVTVTLSAASITATQGLTVTVAVTGGSGTPAPAGSVVLSSGSYTSAVTALSSGSAIITVPAGSLAAGSDTLSATYTPDSAGSATYTSASGTTSVTVTRISPTVSVAPSASSIATTQGLIVTVAVAGGSGNPTPTGSVVLTGGGYTSAATALASGSVAINIPAGSLTPGNDTLTTTYTPDSASSSTYSGASGTSSVTVTRVSPTVTLSLSASSITTIQGLTVTVAVTGGGNLIPTGAVTLTGGGYTSAATALASGSAMINIPAASLAAANDTLTASYTPDAADASIYNAATGTAPVTVTLVSQTITFPAITGTQLASTQLTLLATANSGLTIVYTSITPKVCSVAGAVASLLSSGTCTIQANQPGNSIEGPAQAVTQSFFVYQLSGITSPTPGTTLSGSSATFNWWAGVGVTEYEICIGTTVPGSRDVFSLTTTALTSGVVSNIPTNGVKLHVRFFSLVNKAWKYKDYTYTQGGAPVLAALTSPVPGSTLSGSSATFTWTAGGGVTLYQIRVGTTGAGSNNLLKLQTTALTSGLISNIPTYGAPLYVRLYSLINGAWQYTDSTYTESGSPVLAALTSPKPGSSLTGASATFNWTAGGGVTEYQICIGTTGAGSKNIFSLFTTALTSGVVSNLPVNGRSLFVRLYSLANGAWQYQDYTYTAWLKPVPAALTSPAPGTTLSGSSATFTWTAGAGVTEYELRLGTSGAGSLNVAAVPATTALTSGVVSNIPTTGGTLYARLYSLINGAWQYNDYTYTEQ